LQDFPENCWKKWVHTLACPYPVCPRLGLENSALNMKKFPFSNLSEKA